MEDVVRVISKAIIISTVIVSDSLIKGALSVSPTAYTINSPTAAGLTAAVLPRLCVSRPPHGALTDCSSVTGEKSLRGSRSGLKSECFMKGIHELCKRDV